MGRITVALLSVSFAIAAAGGAQADSYFDVEHARANARAGGPVSEHDAELLERYGALSGTPEWRHRVRDRYTYFYNDEDHYRRPHRKHRRHHRHN